MYVRLNLETIKFFITKLSTNFQWQQSYVIGETSTYVNYMSVNVNISGCNTPKGNITTQYTRQDIDVFMNWHWHLFNYLDLQVFLYKSIFKMMLSSIKVKKIYFFFCATTISITTLSMMTLSITTLSITINEMRHSA